ncbi:MAG: AMP-binding protein [Myxococcales bacterium]
MLTLRDPLEHALRLHADRTAIVHGDGRLRYRDLVTRSYRLGASLRALGLARGDRVALLAWNGNRFVEAFCGIPAAGLTVVPLNTRLAPAELCSIAQDSGARVLLTDRDPGELGPLFERTVRIPDEYDALLEHGAPEPPQGGLDEDDVAALFYTGGTTGLPKGVMLTHRNLVANAFQKALACSLDGDDVFLAAAAMFHVAGVAPLLSLIWQGGTIVTLPSFDPGACLDLIAAHRVTVAMPVPTMVAALVAEQHRAPRDVSSLRMLGHAGSPISNEEIESAHATFPDAELAQFYGATETASIVTCVRHEERLIGTPRLGTCGRAVAGVQVRVVRDDGGECDPGEVGEITVRGDNVTPGYFRKPQASLEALQGGRYHTGDLGVLDEQGYLFVVDRKKDMIVSGGENVYSVEVENALYRHPAVVEAAVFGVPDERWGEAVTAIVVVSSDYVSDGQLPESLRLQCRDWIAGYKVPKQIEVRSEPLPKSGPGKILKRLLRAEHGAAEGDGGVRS